MSAGTGQGIAAPAEGLVDAPDAAARTAPVEQVTPIRRPQVDVGVVTFNTAALSTHALRHLLDSDQGCDLRVLVHDNASADGTVGQLAREVPEAEVEAGSENVGFARAVNRLLARCDAPWFLALNSDAWPEPGAVGRLLAAGERHADAAAVAPRLLRPDGSVEHSTHGFPSLGVAAADALGLRGHLPVRWAQQRCLAGYWSHDRARQVDWAVGAALLVRRSAVEEAGGFDERFFMYVEDLAWCWSVRQAGWTVWFEPAATVRHVGNASGAAHFGGRRAALEVANRQLFLVGTRGRAWAEAFRALEVAASLRASASARRGGDCETAAHWRHQAKCLLGVVPVPVPGVHLAPGGTTGAHAAPGHSAAEPEASSERSEVRDASGESAVDEAGLWTSPAAREDARRSPQDPPLVSVVVPTCDRADHLGRLLRALAAQTLWQHDACGAQGPEPGGGDPGPEGAVADRGAEKACGGGRAPRCGGGVLALHGSTRSRRWSPGEIVVVDDASADDTQAVAAEAARWCPVPVTVLRQPVRLGPAAARNRGWRRARGSVVAFTDDYCMPSPRWLAAGLAAMDGTPMAVVGRTEPPREQLALGGLPFARVLRVRDARFAETCNVFYRRSDLASVGGFDERFRRPSGEDTRLALDLRAAGLVHHYHPDALVHHDVRTGGWRAAWSETSRWADLPLVVAGRPWARRELAHRMVFWKPTHPPALGLVVGLAAARRRRTALVLCGPWLWRRLVSDPVCGSPAGRVWYLPAAAALDLLEVAVMVRGSWRHRTVLL